MDARGISRGANPLHRIRPRTPVDVSGAPLKPIRNQQVGGSSPPVGCSVLTRYPFPPAGNILGQASRNCAGTGDPTPMLRRQCSIVGESCPGASRRGVRNQGIQVMGARCSASERYPPDPWTRPPSGHTPPTPVRSPSVMRLRGGRWPASRSTSLELLIRAIESWISAPVRGGIWPGWSPRVTRRMGWSRWPRCGPRRFGLTRS